MGLTRDERLKAALRENLKRRKAGPPSEAREKKGTVAADRPGDGDEGSKREQG